MPALDTDVVVRLLIGDDPAQTRAADQLVAAKACTVALSVLVECEWVLRGSYGLERGLIAASMRGLLALENIEPLEPELTDRVLSAYEAGLDLADALHAQQRREGDVFATFDKALARKATKGGLNGVQLLKTKA